MTPGCASPIWEAHPFSTPFRPGFVDFSTPSLIQYPVNLKTTRCEHGQIQALCSGSLRRSSGGAARLYPWHSHPYPYAQLHGGPTPNPYEVEAEAFVKTFSQDHPGYELLDYAITVTQAEDGIQFTSQNTIRSE